MRARIAALAATATLLAAAPAVATAAPGGQLSDGDYWAFADRRQADVEPQWRADLGVYLPVQSIDDVRLDANMLLTHAAAALAKHQGPSRKDDRVVLLARALTRFPAYLQPPDPNTTGQTHVPGWTSSTQRRGGQHVAVDPQVAEALTAAWEARDVVEMPPDLALRIQQTITDVAASPFFRYPAMLLTQFNWHADMDAFAARVTGNPSFLADYRLQLLRFAKGAKTPIVAGRTAYLNKGLGMIYSPRNANASGAALLSSPEYENLVFSGLRHYDWAVAKGMKPLPSGQEAVLRKWSQRVLFGDWTHAGYLNWDTSLGTRRWQLTRYWGFAQQGLTTLITARRLAAVPGQEGWASWIADRGLETYEHLAAETGGKLPSALWDVKGRDGAPVQDPVFTASRMQAHAARMAQLQIGARRASPPPAWFAYDPDAQRLAVSSPRYSTAILVRHPTDDYGGIEMARLLSGAGDPVSGTGGSGRAAFGLDLARGGRIVLDTQPGAKAALRGETTLSVRRGGSRDLRGVVGRGVVAEGRVRTSAGAVDVSTRFGEQSIVVTRRVEAARDGTATVRFPVWGTAPSVRLVRRGGKVGSLRGTAVNAKGAEGLLLRADHGGYRVGLCTLPDGARLRLASVGAPTTSRRTRRVALLSFPVKKGQKRTVGVRLVATDDAPQPLGGGARMCP
ncbi:hypothetical protein [Patulibacter defluvii]|uniref:hypothetical protein n=1 Tax=Patulibacter defluvii TaxID=3095358 RepID=UPI002A753B8F|nr:hypothetical protein [Patulibacter sp. DM4]